MEQNKLMVLRKEFQGNNVDIIVDEKGELLFELYSIGMALGQVKVAKGNSYPRKERINSNIENAEISTCLHDDKQYIDINGLRKLISLSNTKNKGKFIEWLKFNNMIKQEEVFEYIRKEEIFMESLTRVLKPIGYSLDLQKVDSNYRLDGYIPELDIVIEYDENGHMDYNKQHEVIRENYIKEKYKNLIRLTDFNDLMTNIGMVINKIMEVA